MVIVKEVYLAIKRSDAEGFAPMAEDREYDITKYSYVEPEKSYKRKVKNYYKDKAPEGDRVEIESFISASKYNGEKIYCSWYY